MRPVLKPALRRVWRDATTLQLGITQPVAVVLADAAEVRPVLALLDGTRERAEVLADAAALGLPHRNVGDVLDLLAAVGVLDDAAADTRVLAELPAAERFRLAPDLASLTLQYPEPGGALAALRRRQAACVRVLGLDRVGACVSVLLAAAGVGTVVVVDPEPVTLADVSPGGFRTADVGRCREAAMRDLLSRIAPSCRSGRPGAADGRRTAPADLVVLVGSERSRTETNALVRAGQPHLTVEVEELLARVGPLVLPGRSACIGCLDRHRSDRDPGWPAVVATLSRPVPGTPPLDVLLVATAAARAAAEVVAVLDRGGAPSAAALPYADAADVLGAHDTVNGTLETSLRDLRWRRRSWRPHDRCDCADRRRVPLATAG